MLSVLLLDFGLRRAHSLAVAFWAAEEEDAPLSRLLVRHSPETLSLLPPHSIGVPGSGMSWLAAHPTGKQRS